MNTADTVSLTCAAIALVILLGLIIYTVTVGCARKQKPSRDRTTNQEAPAQVSSPAIDNAVSGIDNPGMQEVGVNSDSSVINITAELNSNEEKSEQCSLQSSKL